MKIEVKYLKSNGACFSENNASQYEAEELLRLAEEQLKSKVKPEALERMGGEPNGSSSYG
jgi:hypothetical protein